MKINKNASILFTALVATGIFLVIFSAAISYGLMQQKFNKVKIASIQALNISEAGIDYYRWLLYHNNEDYCDGTTCTVKTADGYYGPYIHTYSQGGVSGQYQLYIKPPEDSVSTSTLAIKSIAWTDAYPNIKRTIQVKLQQDSWASFLLLSGSDLWLPKNTTVRGKAHSSGGIRFDGIQTEGFMSSALTSYADLSDTSPGHCPLDFGVHTHATTTSYTNPDPCFVEGTNPPYRPDIFGGDGRRFPANRSFNFESLGDYASHTAAMAGLDLSYIGGSGKYGYYIELMPGAGGNINIYEVTSLKDSECIGAPNIKIPDGTNKLNSYNRPANGIIYAHDNVWIKSKNGGEYKKTLNILAFKDPVLGADANITIIGTISYGPSEKENAIGLIAQNNIYIDSGLGNGNPDIRGAMLAVKGKIQRPDYSSSSCSQSKKIKNSLKILGSVAAKEGIEVSYFNALGVLVSGYTSIDLDYDEQLLQIPPPRFPSSGEYKLVSWDEK